MLEFSFTHLTWALLLGLVSAASLPLGSVVGLLTRPRRVLLGFLAAFGAGALFAALAVELVAPTVEAVAHRHEHPETAGQTVAQFAFLVAGSLIGCVIFVVLDQLVNAHGGFLRKSATTVAYFTRKRADRERALLHDLGKVKAFHNLPQVAIQSLVDIVKPVHFNRGDVLFEQGESGDELFILRDGKVQLFQDNQAFRILEGGSVLGEMALLTGAPRVAKAVAESGVHALMVRTEDFERLRKQFPELDEAVREMVTERMDELAAEKRQRAHKEHHWAKRASRALRSGTEVPSRHDLQVAHQSHSGAPMAIWLGILLDGVPESFVIGTGLAALLLTHQAAGLPITFLEVVPYTLIAGLFLSNFPEALSSSVGMREQGMSFSRVFWLWFSLMIMTGVGAGVGYAVGGALPTTWVIGVQGVAAGAMLTMIAAAMIPEAAHRGGPMASGIGTMLGFVAAISFKLLE